MGEQIYDKAALHKRVLALLRENGEPMITGHVAVGLALPFWAVELALEDAWLAKEVVFTPGVGWAALALPVAMAASDAAQGEIGS